MNNTSVKTDDPRESAEAKRPDEAVESFELVIQQIEAQASTQTQVLLDVLEREETSQFRNWGIND